MNLRHWFLALGCAVPLLIGNGVRAGAEKRPTREITSFGTLQTASPEAARGQALAWLQKVGRADAATLKKFDAIWAENDRSVLDRVAESLALGDSQAAQLLEEARDPSTPAPTEVPPLLKDSKKDPFFRANLTLAYAKALAHRRVYEEELQALRLVKPDDNLVDPASYFFHRAVAEHALMLKDDASRSIVGVMEDCADAPERYQRVSVLMLYDMQTWQPKDLGEIARKMDNIERRLALARGGPQTQKMQKDVELRLKELIKKLENQAKGSANCNGGSCPGSQIPGSSSGPTPMQDSNIARLDGKGIVGNKQFQKLVKNWGKLPEKERTEALANLTRGMPARHREIIENYLKKIAQSPPGQP